MKMLLQKYIAKKTYQQNHCFYLFLVEVAAFQVDDGFGKVCFHICFSGATFFVFVEVEKIFEMYVIFVIIIR